MSDTDMDLPTEHVRFRVSPNTLAKLNRIEASARGAGKRDHNRSFLLRTALQEFLDDFDAGQRIHGQALTREQMTDVLAATLEKCGIFWADGVRSLAGILVLAVEVAQLERKQA